MHNKRKQRSEKSVTTFAVGKTAPLSPPLIQGVIWQEGTNSMLIAQRIILLIVIVLSVYYFVYWVPFSLIPLGDELWIQNLVSILVAVLFGWLFWGSTKQCAAKGLGSSIFLGALIVGGIGFVGGFFGPIIFMPSSNQGPMLGLFITGPFGFLFGAFGGLIYWLVKSRGKSSV